VPAGPEPTFSRYRRRLPHWRLTGAIYFVTWRLHPPQPDLCPEKRDRIVAALRHFDGQRYDLFAFVVMNDHIHVLLKPRASRRLEDILHSWKSFAARELQRHHGRIGAVWQNESFDRIVRDEDEFWQKVEYILTNAAKRWVEYRERDYRWAWLCSADAAGLEPRPARAYIEDLAGLRPSGDVPAGTEARPTDSRADESESHRLPGRDPAGTEARPSTTTD